jgi:hypothetical protein
MMNEDEEYCEECCFFKNDDGGVHMIHNVVVNGVERIKTFDMPEIFLKKIQSEEMREAFRQWTEEEEPALYPPAIYDAKEWGFVYQFDFKEDNLYIGFFKFDADCWTRKVGIGQYNPKKYVILTRKCYKNLLKWDM